MFISERSLRAIIFNLERENNPRELSMANKVREEAIPTFKHL